MLIGSLIINLKFELKQEDKYATTQVIMVSYFKMIYLLLNWKTTIIYINIFSHKQHTFCWKFYYVAYTFDPELRSSLGHDTRIYIYI